MSSPGMTALWQAPRDLWITLSIKFCEGIAMFSAMYILVKYLTDGLGYTDVNAGWLFALCNGLQFPLGLGFSPFIDMFGFRRLCIVGGAILLLARGILLFSTSWWVVGLTLVTLYPLGTALLFPAMVIGVKRYSNDVSMPYAFGLFYMLVNVASLIVAGSIFMVRTMEGDIYNAALLVGCGASAISFSLSLFLRDLQVDDGSDLAAASPPSAGAYEIITDALRSPVFWRFLAVIFSFVMVRMVFGHLKSTVPKWMTREFGEATPYELYIGLNAALIIILVPICTRASEMFQLNTSSALLVGAVISGFSPFWLAFFPPSLMIVVLFIATFSIGEAMWSPRLYEYTVSVPKEGREGLYAAFGSAPLYLAKFLAGVSSGYLLHDYCPRQDYCSTRKLWLIIACSTAVTPVILGLGRNYIFPAAQKEAELEAGEKQPLVKS